MEFVVQMLRFGYAYPAGKLIKPSRGRVSESKLIETGRENLFRIADALEWNEGHKIKVFRIPFETIPFTSNSISWKKDLDVEGEVLGDYIRKKRMRLFIRLPSACSISSHDPAANKRGLAATEHAAAILELLNTGADSKAIAQIGRIRNRRRETAKRFINSFSKLSEEAKKHLVVENDATHWSFYDTFGLAGKLNIPIVFNYSAFMQNHFTELSPADTIRMNAMSWKQKDGAQKIHYSETVRGEKRKSSISKKPFLKFYEGVQKLKADVIINTEGGGRSALKAQEYIR